jgi:type I restriction enzyme S subunit
MREYAQANFTGTVGQQHAPEEFMENLRMPLPPLPLQHRFAAQMEAFRALRARLDDLFQSLLHRAFAGELI